MNPALAVKNVPALQHPADVMATCGEAAEAALLLTVCVCVCEAV